MPIPVAIEKQTGSKQPIFLPSGTFESIKYAQNNTKKDKKDIAVKKHEVSLAQISVLFLVEF